MDAAGKAAAFFDLDNTLLHGSSLYFIGRGMHARGIVSTSDALRGVWQQLVFRVAGERSSLVAAVRDWGLALGAGIEVAPLIAMGEQLYDEMLAPRILHDTVRLARDHLVRGEDVYLVTAAPVELARIVATRLGLTGALGTVSEVADARWTGRLVGELLHGPAKAAAVRRLAAAHGYDLATCSAYSDSINDLSLFELVGHPHAVNPDRRLRAVAATRGWPVHDFRLRRHWPRAAVTVGGVAAIAVGVYIARRPVPLRSRVAPLSGRGLRAGGDVAAGLGQVARVCGLPVLHRRPAPTRRLSAPGGVRS